jgi:hypothetical protein
MHRIVSLAALAVLLIGGCTSKQQAGEGGGKPMTAVTGDSKTGAAPFQDEPAAHALYNQMIEALRKADSLSFVSHCEFKAKPPDSEGEYSEETYRIWLKKPN